jgi:hypothetical protein
VELDAGAESAVTTAHQSMAQPVDTPRYEVQCLPLPKAPAEWDDLASPREVDFGSSRAWNLAMAGADGAEVAVQVAVPASPPGSGPADVHAIVPVFHYSRRREQSTWDPARLFAGSCPELDRSPSAWAPVTMLGSIGGAITSPAAVDPAAWVAAVYSDLDRSASTIAVPYLSDAFAASIRPLVPDTALLLITARAVLDLPYRSWEEYEASLPKRKRTHVRYERRLLRRGGRTITIEPLGPATIAEIAPLQASTQQRHGADTTADDIAQEYARLATSALAGSVVLFICRHDDRAIGYAAGIVRDGTVLIYAAGLDYERTGSYAEYFNLLVHEPVDYCLRNGLRGIDFGPGGFRQKMLRGGRLDLIWSLLVRSPAVWTPAISRRHNRIRAELLAMQFGHYLTGDLADRLGQMVSTGEAHFAAETPGADGQAPVTRPISWRGDLSPFRGS